MFPSSQVVSQHTTNRFFLGMSYVLIIRTWLVWLRWRVSELLNLLTRKFFSLQPCEFENIWTGECVKTMSLTVTSFTLLRNIIAVINVLWTIPIEFQEKNIVLKSYSSRVKPDNRKKYSCITGIDFPILMFCFPQSNLSSII